MARYSTGSGMRPASSIRRCIKGTILKKRSSVTKTRQTPQQQKPQTPEPEPRQGSLAGASKRILASLSQADLRRNSRGVRVIADDLVQAIELENLSEREIDEILETLLDIDEEVCFRLIIGLEGRELIPEVGDF